MIFFRHQKKAKQHTALLILLLLVALCCLISLACFVASAVFFIFIDNGQIRQSYSAKQLVFSPINVWIMLVVTAFVLMASIYKWLQIHRGGKAVAEALGGRLISPDTNVPEERKAINVVAKMAIATGNPVPSVYLVDDTSINAFAAGNCRRSIVIGVTRGCIKTLDRNELQGVIAHEFSHIHNQDTRLDMRIVAILHGIVIIGLLGYKLTRGRKLSQRAGTNYAALPGFLLLGLGYCGTFLGSVIKTAFSHQREFLADASAVQFTRNINGISGALKKIGGLSYGSYLSSARAAEFSHIFFGQPVRSPVDLHLPTHPPIIERIKRIDPKWNGSYETNQENKPANRHHETLQKTIDEVRNKYSFQEQAINFIGSPQGFHEISAQALIEAIPEAALDYSRNAFTARAVVYALLINCKTEVRETQLNVLQSKLETSAFAALKPCLEFIGTLPRSLHFTLIQLCLPAIKQLSQTQFAAFKSHLMLLLEADNQITLPEYCLYKIVVQNYQAVEFQSKYTLQERHQDISVLFSLVVYAGNSPSPGGAFKAAINTLEVKDLSFKLSDENFGLQSVEDALSNLCEVKLPLKQNLLSAVAAIIGHDGEVDSEAAELFRAIGDILDCPIPPILV